MKRERIFGVIMLLLIWEAIAAIVNNDIIIPYPAQVALLLGQILSNPVSYIAIGASLGRVVKGMLLSCITAIICSILSYCYPRFGNMFEPLHVLTKTIPNASYIIIALIWFGSEGAVSVVTFMILFPIFYNGFMNSLTLEDKSIVDAEKLYEDTFKKRLKVYFFPKMKTEFLLTGKTAASMGIKVGVMAEILGQVRTGIGRQLQYARLDLNTSLLFAWTIVIILLAVLIDMLFDRFIEINKNKEEHLWNG